MPELSPPAILYADDALIVAVKPAGLLCVPGRGADKQDCLSQRVQLQYPDALIVHRLDMATSGLCAMARGADAQRLLSQAFASREVHKRYEALVHGELRHPQALEGSWAEIDLPLITDWPNRPRSKVDFALGKPSLTRWQALAYDPVAQVTRVVLEPVTGRSHQLRVHLLSLGHPIVGDSLYGPTDLAAPSTRLMLHATHLDLPHPLTGLRAVFESPCPF